MLQLGSILEPTWLHFGKVLEAKMGPSWHQIAPKLALQIDQKIDHISDRSWHRFWPILGTNLEPKTAQDPPSWSQDAAKTLQNGAKIRPKLITFNEHDPKYPQSRPRTAPWTSFSLIFDGFLILFSLIFVRFLIDF